MRAILFLVPGLLGAAIGNVQVQGTTPIQAVLSYTAPDKSACQVEAYNLDEEAMALEIATVANTTPIKVTLSHYAFAETGDKVYIYGNAAVNGYWTITREASDPRSFRLNGSTARGASSGGRAAVLIHDLNPRLFTGADRDDREGNLVNGRERTIVIGKRAAELALNGWYMSRALQAYTAHQYRIVCGADERAGTFRTPNIALGNTQPNRLPSDPDRPGRYAYPSIDWSHPAIPGNGTLSATGATATFATDEILAAGDYVLLTSGPNAGQQRRVSIVPDTRHATLSAAFSHNQTNVTWAKRPPDVANGTQRIIDPTTGMLMRRVTGPQAYPGNSYGNAPTSVTPGTGWPDSATTLAAIGAAGGTQASYTGNANLSWLFVQLPAAALNENDYSQTDWLTVTVQGSGNAVPESDDNAIELCLTENGSTCKSAILSVNLNTCAPWTKVGSQCWVGTEYPAFDAWLDPADRTSGLIKANEWGANSGFLVRKKTATANTISLDYFAHNRGRSTYQHFGPAGCALVYSTQTYNGMNREGYHCVFETYNPFLYWINRKTADAVPSAYMNGSGPTWNQGAVYVIRAAVGFDDEDPNVYYGQLSNRKAGGTGIAKLTYTGSNLDSSVNWSNNQNLDALEVTTDSLDNLAQAFIAGHADFPTDYFGCVLAGLIDSRYAHIPCYRTQDTWGWKYIFDLKPETGSPRMVAAAAGYGRYPNRGCGTHSAGQRINSGGWAIMNAQGASTAADNTFFGQGPLVTQLAEAMGTGASSCPDTIFTDRSGGGCTTVQVTGDWQDADPHAYWWVGGSGRVALSNITVAGGTATAAVGNNLDSLYSSRMVVVGNTIRVSGSGVAGLDGDAAVTAVTDTTFSWTTSAANGIYNGAGMVAGKLCGSHFCENNLRGASGFLGEYQAMRTGDILSIDSETMQIMAVNLPQITVKRAVDGTTLASHANGARVKMECAAKPNDVIWDFRNDPYGEDESLTYKKSLPTGHASFSTYGDGYMMSGALDNMYKTYVGTWAEISAKRRAGTADAAWNRYAPFAGLAKDAGEEAHSSMTQRNDSSWGMDGRPSQLTSQTWTQQTGSLYKATVTLNRKKLPTEAMCRYRPMIDVSPGPITANPSDNYKFCVGSGCYSGAGTNDVYVNCPGAATPAANANDIFAIDLPVNFHSYLQQATLKPNRNWEHTRLLSPVFARNREEDVFKTPAAAPDGNWFFAWGRKLDGVRSEIVATKLPPFPGGDSVNRGTFQSVSITLGSVPAGTDNVVVEFGYDSSFRCTTQNESCIANQATVNEATPFYWASESFAGLACAAGCSVTIPALPQRVVYYRIRYRKADGTVVATGRTQVGITL